MGTSLLIQAVEDRGTLKRFLSMPARLYAGDPLWVAPLMFERLEHLNPRKNPYFEHAEVAYWLALRGERPVGRISAQVDRLHLELHQDATGQFGFLEAEDDSEVFAALFEAAETWLGHRGMRRAIGPFSLSVNDESGLLIDGFETPPYMMMGHVPRYYGPRVEQQGYRTAKDLVAYVFDVAAPPPPRARRVLDRLSRGAGLSYRPLDMRRFDDELQAIVDIFNDAWSDNWSFVPMTPAEVRYMGKNLKPILRSEYVWIGEVDGEAAAMTVTLPNVNEAIRDLGGRLLPFGWAKLLWRLKVAGTRTARMPLMGVRRKYQGTPRGAALALGVIEAVRSWHAAHGAKEAELSWVLEDNRPTHEIIQMVGGRPYKTYRVYEKSLA
ncbi:MAG: N-acetyltransferase [Geminicoccaceae bacterium]|nr:N-acetyltransferase [Geminicoccaceae bacterium]